MPTSSGDTTLIIFDPEAMAKGMSLISAIVGATMDAIKLIAMGTAFTRRIASAIDTTQPVLSGDTIKADVHVDLVKAPEAAAYEFGSGVHGLRQHTYPIAPKKAGGSLVFKWENEDMSAGHPHTKDGKVILPFVNHPGVLAHPSIGPAFEMKTGPELIGAIDRIMHEVMHTGEDVNVDSKVFFL